MKTLRHAGRLCSALVSLAVAARVSAEPAALLEPPPEAAAALAARSPEDVDDLRQIEKQLRRVVAQVAPATVSVEVGPAAGSGVIVSREGLVLTAAHVIGRPGREAMVELPDGRRLSAHTLGADHEADAGMLKLDQPPGDLPFAPVTQGGPPALGEWVITTGQPGGLVSGRAPPVRLGRVLYRDRELICTDCKLVGGDSGGPLFNMRGEVIGIHSSIGQSITHNFHVPAAAFRSDWDRLLAGELWGGRFDRRRDGGGPVLGVSGSSTGGRCIITAVADGLPAAKAGVKVGDVVAAVDGRAIATFEKLQDIVAFKRPGEWLTLQLVRDDEALELRLQLARRDGRPTNERPPADDD
jgi:serine protease Do